MFRSSLKKGILMIQMVILGLAIICVLAAASTLISGKIKLN